MNRRSQAGTLLTVFVVLMALGAAAAPRLAVTIGFDGCFVPEHLAALRVDISGIAGPFSGSLLVSERVGNPWRGLAESRTTIPLSLSGDAVQDHVLPIYDFIGPLTIALVGEGQGVVAEETVELRARRRDRPFPVAVGARSSHFDETFVVVDPDSLPVHWGSYEAVSNLWIGSLSGDISQARWEAIGRWVLAGGSLVLFSGADFYRLDSASLRELLPLADPSLSDTDGIAVLRGGPRPGATTLLLRDGQPLVVQRRYGAGTVTLCTVRPADLAAGEFSALATAVAPAKLLSFTAEVEGLREETPVQRPGFPATGLLVVVSLSGFTLIVHRTSRPRQTLTALCCLSGVLCVLSCLYINRANVAVDLYLINTGLQVQTLFGITIDYYALIKSSSGAGKVTINGPAGLIQELPRSLQEHDFGIEASENGARLSLARGERRTLRAYSPAALPMRVSSVEGEKVRVVNGLDGPLEDAVLIAGETAFPLGEVAVGEGSYTLRDARPLGDLVLGREVTTALLRPLRADFFWGDGLWLVGTRERQSVEQSENIRTKVRDLLLVVVSGGGRE